MSLEFLNVHKPENPNEYFWTDRVRMHVKDWSQLADEKALFD